MAHGVECTSTAFKSIARYYHKCLAHADPVCEARKHSDIFVLN